ncbi:MAG: DUF3016 domain-containing protein [Lacunisphaera sp.]|nr:DUF3016 domain-containing protein [Lacunisphaera sp.]
MAGHGFRPHPHGAGDLSAADGIEFRLIDVGGKVVKEGKRRLQELGYLMTLSPPTSDSLRYDKGMISDWMRREFRRSSWP